MSDHESTPSQDELPWQMRAIGEVVNAVARGDFTRKVSLQVPPGMSWGSEQLVVANNLNALVDYLNGFAYKATFISHEVGTEGRFGRQMEVDGEAGSWKDLNESLNFVLQTLTVQTRSLNLTIKNVLAGDASCRVTVEAQGEMKELCDNLNRLIAQSTPAA